MKIQIEKQIEVPTPNNIDGLNAIIEAALSINTKNCFNDFEQAVEDDSRISSLDFFIYYGSNHIAIHEKFADGHKTERLLLITE